MMRVLHKTTGLLLILSFLGLMTLLSPSSASRHWQELQLAQTLHRTSSHPELLPNDKNSCPAECTEHTITLAPLNDLAHPFFPSQTVRNPSGTSHHLQQTFLPAPLLAGIHIKTVILRL